MSEITAIKYTNYKVFSKLMGMQTMRARSLPELMRFIRKDNLKVYKIQVIH